MVGRRMFLLCGLSLCTIVCDIFIMRMDMQLLETFAPEEDRCHRIIRL